MALVWNMPTPWSMAYQLQNLPSTKSRRQWEFTDKKTDVRGLEFSDPQVLSESRTRAGGLRRFLCRLTRYCTTPGLPQTEFLHSSRLSPLLTKRSLRSGVTARSSGCVVPTPGSSMRVDAQ